MGGRAPGLGDSQFPGGSSTSSHPEPEALTWDPHCALLGWRGLGVAELPGASFPGSPSSAGRLWEPRGRVAVCTRVALPFGGWWCLCQQCRDVLRRRPEG